VDRLPAARFDGPALGADPWRLAAGEEGRILRDAAAGAERLDEVTRQIFQGLVTSADPIYILEDRGSRNEMRRAFSPASGEEVDLEPDLLRPLASGRHVDRYAFAPLRRLLLFPYREGEDGRMRLLRPEELAELPHTEAYLRQHEVALRARERGRMDRDGWYGYVYPKSLGAHDLPKLGCAATVHRLEIAADPLGEVYFHNVRVNGILLGEGPSIWTLLALLNSRLLDFVFRRGSVEHRGGHWAANKQFIAPLPIRTDDGGALDPLGRELHRLSVAATEESGGFVSWLEGILAVRLEELRGSNRLAAYESEEAPTLLAALALNRGRLTRDPDARSFRELFGTELAASQSRLRARRTQIESLERQADGIVYDLYRLNSSQRALVDAEYT